MAQHYSTKDFFRRAPNALLERYFSERDIFTDLDLAGLKETKIDPLFEEWLELPDEHRISMETELREIHGLSSEKGFLAIIDEARWHLRNDDAAHNEFVEKLSALPNHYHRAMMTFLEHREYWKGAIRFHHADTLAYWRKRKNMGHRTAPAHEEDCRRLAEAIHTYFHFTEGRGKNCLVEALRRSDLDYFFAYPEDHSQQSIEWVNGEFENRPHNPAFEIVFVYSQSEGSLDLNYRGGRRAIEPLQGMFATEILGMEKLPPDPEDGRVYDLSQLSQPDFGFTYQPESGISDVAVRKIRYRSHVRTGDRITLEANANENPEAIYELRESIGTSLNPDSYDIDQIEVSALISEDAESRPKRVTFRLAWPNTCTLKYDEWGLKLRAMLEASGLEPKEPEPQNGDA